MVFANQIFFINDFCPLKGILDETDWSSRQRLPLILVLTKILLKCTIAPTLFGIYAGYIIKDTFTFAVFVVCLFVCLFGLMLYVHGKQLRSGMVIYPKNTISGQACRRWFTSTRRTSFLHYLTTAVLESGEEEEWS